MTLFGLLLVIHVLVAVLGLGQTAALAVLTRPTKNGESTSASLKTLLPMIRFQPWSLLLMLLSGALLDFTAHGAFHEQWWFRISGILLFVLGFLSAQARRALRQMDSGKLDVSSARSRVGAFAWSSVGLVGVITVLMVQKPW